MSTIQVMEIILSILTVAVFAGAYAIKRLHEAVSAYSSGYGKEAGKIDAATQKIDSIKNKLTQTVQLSESIKKDIEQGAWRQRELEVLKRNKLEEYLLTYYLVKENLTHIMREEFFGVDHDYDRDAFSKLSMLKILYLPELEDEHTFFLSIYSEFMIWIGEGKKMKLDQIQLGEKLPKVSSEHLDGYAGLLEKINQATSKIENKVKVIGQHLNNA